MGRSGEADGICTSWTLHGAEMVSGAHLGQFCIDGSRSDSQVFAAQFPPRTPPFRRLAPDERAAGSRPKRDGSGG
jgi:hypothetical protein